MRSSFNKLQYVQYILCIITVVLSCSRITAQVDPIKIQTARQKVEQTERLYSKEHPKYAWANIHLAQLLYQDPETKVEAHNTYKKGMLLLRTLEGEFKEDYQRALEQLPQREAELLGAEVDYDLLAAKKDSFPRLFAEKEIQLGLVGYKLQIDFLYRMYRPLDVIQNGLSRLVNLEPDQNVKSAYIQSWLAKVPDSYRRQMELELITAQWLKKQFDASREDSIQQTKDLTEYVEILIKNDNYILAYAHFEEGLQLGNSIFGLQGQGDWYGKLLEVINVEAKQLHLEQLKWRQLVEENRELSQEFIDQTFALYNATQKTTAAAKRGFKTLNYLENAFRKSAKHIEKKYGTDNIFYEQLMDELNPKSEEDKQKEQFLHLEKEIEALDRQASTDSILLMSKLVDLGNKGVAIGEKELLERGYKAFQRAVSLYPDLYSNTGVFRKDMYDLVKKIPNPYLRLAKNANQLKYIEETGHNIENLARVRLALSYRYFAVFNHKGLYQQEAEENLRKAFEGASERDRRSFFRNTLFFVQSRPTSAPKLLEKHLSFFSTEQIDLIFDELFKDLGEINSQNIYFYADRMFSKIRVLYHKEETEVSYELCLELLELLDLYDQRGGLYEKYMIDIVNLIEQKSLWDEDKENIFFQKKLYFIDSKHGKDSYDYAIALFEYGNWHYKNDRYVYAEQIYKACLGLLGTNRATLPFFDLEKQFKPREIYYRLGRIYRKTGLLHKAENYYRKALAANKKDDLVLKIECLDDLGLTLIKSKKYLEALDYLEEAWSLLNSEYKDQIILPNVKAFFTVKIKRHLGQVYFKLRDYTIAESIYTEIKELEDADPNDFIAYEKDFSLQWDWALLYTALGEYEKAKVLYTYVETGLKDPYEQIDLCLDIANFYKKQDSLSLAADYYMRVIGLGIEEVQTSYVKLAEEERLVFLASLNRPIYQAFQFFLEEYPSKDNYQIVLDIHLMLNGLSLEASTDTRRIIQESDNTNLENLYRQWRKLRKEFAKLTIQVPLGNPEINTQILEVKKDIIDTEQQMTQISSDLKSYLGQAQKQVNTQQIQALLPTSAVAITFLRIVNKKTAQYYAFIIRPDTSSQPILVKLATEKKLLSILEAEVKEDGINYVADDLENHYLYDLVWEPLNEYLKDYNEIYISPVGVLSKINFGVLLTEMYCCDRVMDHWKIRYYNTFRDLLDQQEYIGGNNQITIFGGVNFTYTDQNLKDIAAQLGLETSYIFDLIDKGIDVEEHFFKYLDGTAFEGRVIQKKFQHTGWECEFFDAEQATEDQFNRIGEYLNPSPQILHIATHGFFFAKSKDQLDIEEEEKWSVEGTLEQQTNPLMRSGLAMAGINHIWSEGRQIKDREDGILTAYEVANTNLANTELVVLSACETGRGDIDNNEGIMGLRRAFKLAGAQKIMVSLWKVPDAATAMLMSHFYTYYLEGKSVQNAFRLAQEKIRAEYPNPYYWGAFIIVE
ncbi:MAG: CHAT domain-containing protein [Saprospiraceae bacterium]|nr:CHAT domain-containing protein [Saprospiraceae bacterium]